MSAPCAIAPPRAGTVDSSETMATRTTRPKFDSALACSKATLAKSGCVNQRLHFLDGLRGICAFYVLIFHEGMVLDEGMPRHTDTPMAPALDAIRGLFSLGHVPVVFFIVLSGFSLMIPVAKREGMPLKGTLGQFAFRRARRILPPYYAALALSLVAVWAKDTITQSPVERALDSDVVVSHLLLVHNFSEDWAFRINGPMWSIPTEWHIYFVFSLLLLPLARRFGLGVVIVLAWVVGSLPNLFAWGGEWYWACPWFLGSFALGMTGATIALSPRFENSWWRDRAPWGLLSLLGLGLVLLVHRPWLSFLPYPAIDLASSLFAFSFVNACVQASRQGSPFERIRELLANRWMVALGGFSYSLYLLQHPFLKAAEWLIPRTPLSANATYVALLVGFTPLMCAAAWVFSRFFELPFTSQGASVRSERRARVAIAD